MPNYCENDLYLSGGVADVVAVLTRIGANKTPPQFDFGTIIPYPDPFKSMDEDAEAFGVHLWPAPDDPEREFKLAERDRMADEYKAKWGTTNDGYNSGGYEWCIAAWGTKWNAGDVARRDYDGRTCITFQTAWGPPAPVVIALAKLFPTVTFTLEYFERGMGYAGGFQCPSQEDYYEEDNAPWEAGIVTRVWEVLGGYRGVRGG